VIDLTILFLVRL